MESTLKSLRGVVDVEGRLTGKNLGEAEVFYNPEEVTLEDLKGAVPLASGEKHQFVVLSVIEESLPQEK